MKSPVLRTSPPPVAPSKWLVFKGVALNDDYPGKDFDAAPLNGSDDDLDASIANALAREDEDLELNIETARRRAITLGKPELPARLVMGLRVYIEEATDLESLCLSASYADKPKLIFEARWPAQVGMPSRLLASGIAISLRKQLRMLLEEGSHPGDDERTR